jgi:hypothetical protein
VSYLVREHQSRFGLHHSTFNRPSVINVPPPPDSPANTKALAIGPGPHAESAHANAPIHAITSVGYAALRSVRGWASSNNASPNGNMKTAHPMSHQLSQRTVMVGGGPKASDDVTMPLTQRSGNTARTTTSFMRIQVWLPRHAPRGRSAPRAGSETKVATDASGSNKKPGSAARHAAHRLAQVHFAPSLATHELMQIARATPKRGTVFMRHTTALLLLRKTDRHRHVTALDQ